MPINTKDAMRCCLLIFVLIAGQGCSSIIEGSKKVLGVSIQHLEKGRSKALSQSFRGRYEDCFDAVLALTDIHDSSSAKDMNDEEENSDNEFLVNKVSKTKFHLFSQNREKRYIVLMGVSGHVNTTEVGVFFTQEDNNIVNVEISSLSSGAKRKVADAIFLELSRRFHKI